jgi:predicted RNase H-like HicB family nuclease
MTYDVLLTRKANKFIARVRQWPVIVVEGESEEEVLRQAQADLQALLAGGRIIQLELLGNHGLGCLPMIPIGKRFKSPCNSTGKKLIGHALRSRCLSSTLIISRCFNVVIRM